MSQAVGEQLERLVGIMARLRAEGGCPWDREQDLRSLRPYLIEEAYEVLDEMDRVGYGKAPWRPLCEELGDLLFQIVFHAQLANELGEFGMADVCKAISDKIESRHPHVFGTRAVKVKDAEDVLDNWAKLKAEERRKKHGHEGSVLDGVPSGAPALLRAERLTEKASRIGFDWPDLAGVRAKVDEELAELDEAIGGKDRDHLEHELGDVFFALANLARFIKTPPEDAARQANRRFTLRFQKIEAKLRAQGVPFGGANLEQLDALWNEAKREEKLLPPPRELPRASVVTVRLPAAELGAQRAFWDALAPALGWHPVHGAEPTYSDGMLAITFFASGAKAEGGVELWAPSRTAVDALAKKVGELGASATVNEDRGRYGATFVDPAGHRWQYRADV